MAWGINCTYCGSPCTGRGEYVWVKVSSPGERARWKAAHINCQPVIKPTEEKDDVK